MTWSKPAAIRALRAMVIVPGLFALCFEVIGNGQMTLYAVFGAFGGLVFASFGGTTRDKAIAHAGLTIVGALTLTVGTLVSGSTWLAAIVTVPVAFAIFFAGVAGPNAASGITAALLLYVLPVSSAGSLSVIPWRLAGWLLASAVATAAVLAFSPRSAGDQLRAAAAASAGAQAHHLEAAIAGTATTADLESSVEAKHKLMSLFSATPYRPIGLAVADQALAGAIHMLEWCGGLIGDAVRLNLSAASEPDKRVLAEATAALRSVAALLTGREAGFDLEPIWHARTASAVRMEQLAGDEATVRHQVGYAYHAQAIGLAASVAAADAMVASGRASRQVMARERQRWVDGLMHTHVDVTQAPTSAIARLADLVAADATSRSVWFRNSARGAIALAGAVIIARLTNVQHGFWVVLGTLSVLRTSAAATGSTALNAVAGTVLGFVIGGALVIGIGTSQPALWAALPIAVLISAYAQGTAPFAVGQAAFTVTIVVLFNLLHPAGWRVGLVRIEDVALGCAVSAVVGIMFWPRGAASVVGDNLADALRSGAAYVTESARWALDLGKRHSSLAIAAVAAGSRLDDAVRSYLTEQGSKRLAMEDLWMLVMGTQRIRLTAHSLASIPVLGHRHSAPETAGARHLPQFAELATFYDSIATQVGPPGRNHQDITEISPPATMTQPGAGPDGRAANGNDPDALWVQLHLEHLCSHAAGFTAPAARLAVLRRTSWWRSPPQQKANR